MEEAGLFLKKENCSFMASSVTYLVHAIGTEGLRPQPEKVDAMLEAMKDLPLTAVSIQDSMRKDPTLS